MPTSGKTHETQTDQLVTMLADFLDAIDRDLATVDTPMPQRPLQALLRLLKLKAVEVRFQEEEIDLAEPFQHSDEIWFRVLYKAVERWFQKIYGAESVEGKGNPPLEGVVLIRGTPFALRVPAYRTKVQKEGLEAWMYFESGIGEGEDALRWLVAGPDLSVLDAQSRGAVDKCVSEIAMALRAIHFHRMGVTNGPAAEGLADAARGYLESGARRIRSGKAEELGPAWFDLQMACEAALKLVLLRSTGGYPRSHLLLDLLSDASIHGVAFDPARIKSWPDFKTMSDFRYAQGSTGGIVRLFEAYRIAVDLVAAAMATISTPLGSGAGFLLRRPPWLTDSAHNPEEPSGSAAPS